MAKKILINDGIHPTGLKMLVEAGYDVRDTKIAQEELPALLPDFHAICVRSATQVRRDLIDACGKLEVIGRGGVGLDNIDVEYARSKNIKVVNTRGASSQSVAELTFAHIFSLARFLFQSNRMMPEDGDNNFKGLKKAYSKGFELEGKTIGLIGFGRIGQETARIALGLGMKVMPVDPFLKQAEIMYGYRGIGDRMMIKTVEMDEMLAEADIITIHVPAIDKPVLSKREFEKMKEGVYIVNTARGGTINEDDLLEALDSGKVASAGLDVFENEPNPRMDLLQHPRVSLSPHIGASTVEAQEKIGMELANSLISILGNGKEI